MRIVINEYGTIVEDKDELKRIADRPKELRLIEMSRYTFLHGNVASDIRGVKLKFNAELFLNDVVYWYSDGSKIGYS